MRHNILFNFKLMYFKPCDFMADSFIQAILNSTVSISFTPQ